MPFKWIQTLRQPRTEPGFMEDSLSRYGYLPNERSYPARNFITTEITKIAEEIIFFKKLDFSQ